MAQAMTMDRVAAGRAADDVDAGCSLSCACWDCRAWRRHLLKRLAVVLLVCGLVGQAAWQRGLLSPAPEGGAELASVAGVSAAAWF